MGTNDLSCVTSCVLFGALLLICTQLVQFPHIKILIFLVSIYNSQKSPPFFQDVSLVKTANKTYLALLLLYTALPFCGQNTSHHA